MESFETELPGPVGTVVEESKRALHRAREAERAAQRAGERHTQLQSLSVALASAVTVEQVADTILRNGLAALGADAGSVALLTEETTELMVVRSSGSPAGTTASYPRYPVDASLPTADVVRTGESLYIETSAERNLRYPYLAQEQAGGGRGAMVALPLLADGNIIGGIELSFPADHPFSDEDRAFMETISQISALALTRVRLYQEAQREIAERKQAEAELRRRSEEATLLYEAGNLLGSTLDPDQIYDTLHTLIAEIMDCDSLFVSSYTPEDNMIRCAYAWIDGKRVDAATLPAIPLAPEGRGMQSAVIRTGEPLLIRDTDERVKRSNTAYHVLSDGTVLDGPDENEPRTRSALMVPIKLEGRVLGTAQVMSNRKEAYTEEHLRILEAILLQVAAASRNAFLYQQAQKEIAERTRAEEEIVRLNQDLRKQTEELQNQQQWLESVLNLLPAAMLFVEPQTGRITFSNRAADEMAGGEFPKANSAEEYHTFYYCTDAEGNRLPDSEIPGLRVARGERLQGFEMDWHTPDGAYPLIVYGDNLPAMYGHAPMGVILFQDITRLKQIEADLRSHQAQIEGLNARLRQAMTETHHRVKNNLQVITAMIDMQMLEYGEAIPVSEHRRLSTHIQTLAALHDLLTQQAKEDAIAQFVSARAVLQKVVGTLQQVANPRRVRLETQDARLSVRQASALALILNETVSNALKHGIGTIEVSFTVSEETAFLAVCDSGPGFAEGFDPSSHAHTGIELLETAVKWDLAGSIRYENRAEGGARVAITFPLATE